MNFVPTGSQLAGGQLRTHAVLELMSYISQQVPLNASEHHADRGLACSSDAACACPVQSISKESSGLCIIPWAEGLLSEQSSSFWRRKQGRHLIIFCTYLYQLSFEPLFDIVIFAFCWDFFFDFPYNTLL